MTRPLLLPAVLACSLAVAACGDPGTTPAAKTTSPEDAQLAFTRCMREHGIDIPDPKDDGSGRIIFGGPGKGGKRPSPEKMQAADKACRKHLDAVEPPKLSEEQKQEMTEGALAHARCMREHGIDFPDPTFDDNGGARVRIGPGSGIDPNSPRFKKAQEECRDELPGDRARGRSVSPR